MNAFKGKRLTSVKMPDTIETIGAFAFSMNEITSLQLSKNINDIGNMVFYSNKLTTVTIPNNWIRIPTATFGKNELTSVTIPEGVKAIAKQAFTDNKLEAIDIPESVGVIASAAFANNQLKDVNISANVRTIEKGAFDGNADINLKYKKLIDAIEVAESLDTSDKTQEEVDTLTVAINLAKEINNKSNASLAEVDDAVSQINLAIESLENDGTESTLKEIKALEDVNVSFGTSESDLILKLPKKVTLIDTKNAEHTADILWQISGYDGNISKEYEVSGSFDLPENMVQSSPAKDLTVSLKVIVSEKIEDGKWDTQDFQYSETTITGFSNSGLEKFKTNKNVVLPSLNKEGQAIREIGDQAFLIADFSTKQDPEIGINSVKLPDTIKVIGREAFRFNSLTAIDIPEGVNTIKMSAFNGNCIESLVIPESVTTLEGGAFTINEISSLTLPSNMTVIPPAFAFNKLTTLTIPEGVTRIDDLAFSDNELTEINLPSTLKYLSGLNNNSFKSITIPKNVEELGFKALASNKMTSVTIPGNVKIVGKRAFWNTWHDQFLSSVTIEEGVETLVEYSFESNQLKDVNLPSSLKEIGKGAFNKNLGHDGVVHLFTPDYKNPNNLLGSEKYVINPAKVTIKYQFENNTLKEESIFKDSSTGQYFYIGDTDVGITPKYNDSEYELKDISSKAINLTDKETIVTFECKKKDVVEELRIKSIGEVGSVAVNLGTSKNLAIEKLAKKTFIIDTNDKKHEVSLNWTVESYDENKSGEYQAVGTFELPQGILQSGPEMKLEVKSNIVVKENLEDSNWTKDDFIYEGTILKGLSEVGKEKIKTVKDLSLPSENPTGQSITHIGASAFKELDIEKVILPKQIREIGALAFSKNKISYVDFPGTIERVENQAFGNNNIVDITFADGEGTICLDSLSFLENKLTNITILKEVKKVHEDAFKNNLGHGDDNNKVHIYLSKFDPENNGLFDNSVYHKIIELSVESIEPIEAINVDYGTAKENIDLPNKINVKLNNGDIRDVDVEWTSQDYDGQNAGEYIFRGSYDLPEIKTGEKVEATAKVIVKEKPEEKSDFEFLNGTITKYIGTETDVKIPEMINGETVVAIGRNAFNKKGLTSVEIPSTVKDIEQAAFAMNELTEVVLPTSLNSLGNMAFFKNKLTSLKINDGLEVISTSAFSGNELTTVEIPESVTSIAKQAFMNNKLETINIPTNINDIGESTFASNNLSEVIIPKSIVTIGSKAFGGNINIKLKYTGLVEAIDIAEKVDTTGNTEEAIKMLEEAIQLGKELNAKTNATLAEVNEMVKKINDAIEALAANVTIEDYAV